MKPKISSYPGLYTRVWYVEIEGKTTYHSNFESASLNFQQRLKRLGKEQRAALMLSVLKPQSHLLQIKEEEFINKLKPKGITVRQYGYLKGIYERAQRAW